MLKNTPSINVPINSEDNGILLPLVLSTLVHVFIVVFVIYTHHIPQIEQPIAIETSIITPKELEQIQSNIQANIEDANRNAIAAGMIMGTQAASDPNQTHATKASQDPVLNQPSVESDSKTIDKPTVRHSAPMISRLDQAADTNQDEPEGQFEYDKSIEQAIIKKNEAFEIARATFAEQIAAELAAEQQAMQDKLAQESAEQQQLLEQFKEAENNPRETAKPRVQITIAPADANNDVIDDVIEHPNHTLNVENSQAGTNSYAASNQRATNNSVSDAAMSAQLKDHIDPHWTPPTGSTGKKVSAGIHVDVSSGRVTSVTITESSGNSALDQSLKAAIYAASPLTPLIGTNKSSIKLVFIAQ